jgi:hypothetical protein
MISVFPVNGNKVSPRVCIYRSAPLDITFIERFVVQKFQDPSDRIVRGDAIPKKTVFRQPLPLLLPEVCDGFFTFHSAKKGRNQKQ